MPARLVALDDGPDIPLDRAMVVVGRHPQCDVRLDSLRVSRHHCCMTQDHGEVIVRDLGSTNGIRINGQRVEFGRLRSNDELSIAHIRYRLDNGQAHEPTMADNGNSGARLAGAGRGLEAAGHELLHAPKAEVEAALAGAGAMVRGLLPAGLADRCRIQVIVKMDENEVEAGADRAEAGEAAAAAE
jgi:hypothetical protein